MGFGATAAGSWTVAGSSAATGMYRATRVGSPPLIFISRLSGPIDTENRGAGSPDERERMASSWRASHPS